MSKETTPSSRWKQKGDPDPHGTRYDCERAMLCKGELTDDELANALYRCDHRTSFESVGLITAAKDRIRWLSRKLEEDGKGESKDLIEQLQAERDALQKEVDHCKANIKNLTDRNALLRERHDLPVDRIPAHDNLIKLQDERDARHAAAELAIQADAELEKIKELADKYKWQVRDTCVRAEKAEKERDALKARIEGGVRVEAWKNQFGHTMANEPGFGEGNEGCNATLIIDDGVNI